MSHFPDTPDGDSLHLEDESTVRTDDLFISPTELKTRKLDLDQGHSTRQQPQSRPATRSRHGDLDEEESSKTESRDAALRAELAQLQHVNEVISSTVASLRKAKENMGTVQTTVANANTLLDTWTRILSQTEHNQRLILNPKWQGASQDVADEENEVLRRQEERERREREEQERREELARRAEDERRKAEAAASSRGSKVSGRGRGRGGVASGASKTATSTSKTGYVGVGGQGGRGARGSTTGSSRGGSGIGRGGGGLRGRGK